MGKSPVLGTAGIGGGGGGAGVRGATTGDVNGVGGCEVATEVVGG